MDSLPKYQTLRISMYEVRANLYSDKGIKYQDILNQEAIFWNKEK